MFKSQKATFARLTATITSCHVSYGKMDRFRKAGVTKSMSHENKSRANHRNTLERFNHKRVKLSVVRVDGSSLLHKPPGKFLDLGDGLISRKRGKITSWLRRCEFRRTSRGGQEVCFSHSLNNNSSKGKRG